MFFNDAGIQPVKWLFSIFLRNRKKKNTVIIKDRHFGINR